MKEKRRRVTPVSLQRNFGEEATEGGKGGRLPKTRDSANRLIAEGGGGRKEF